MKPGIPPAQLYDLEKDPNQTTNVYNEYPEVVQEMAAIISTYQNPETGKKKDR